jgi:hypothetical protein
MATDVTKFGRETESGAYMTCYAPGRERATGGAWYFCPTDRDWLAFNGNDSFSAAYETEGEALAAAERWEAEND